MPHTLLPVEDVAAVLDEAAEAVGMPPFEDNPIFSKGAHHRHEYRHYILQPSSKAYVCLEVEAHADGITLMLDRVPEALEWGTKDLSADRAEVVRFLAEFFSGYLVIEQRNAWMTRLTLFRPDGEQAWSFKHYIFGGTPPEYQRRLFLPLNSLGRAS